MTNDGSTAQAALVKVSADNPHGLVGIVSTAPGISLGSDPKRVGADGKVPLALAGRVPVKFRLDNGPVEVGDKLTLSTHPGEAVKAGPHDITIGTALEAYDHTMRTHKRTVMTLVHLEYARSAPVQPSATDKLDAVWKALKGLKRENRFLRRRLKRMEKAIRVLKRKRQRAK